MPCYVLGAISYLVVAKISDMHQLRGLYQVGSAVVCIIGYGILIAPAGLAVHYFATLLIALGLFVAVGIPLAWLPSNNPRYGKRTTASGIQIMVCNISGITSPFVSIAFLSQCADRLPFVVCATSLTVFLSALSHF